MNYIGISAGFHDASISVIDDNGNIIYAAHSERYSKIKHDKNLHPSLVNDALSFCKDQNYSLHYYEQPLKKFLRQMFTGEECFLKNLSVAGILNSQHQSLISNAEKTKCVSHHLSHVAAGFQTSPFERATVVVIDAIGEWDTISIWGASYDNNKKAKYKKLWSKRYPNSIGLFYSAMTKRVGLKPLDEEYILMGMSAYGKPSIVNELKTHLINDMNELDFKENLHIGVSGDYLEDVDIMDIAASTQHVVEEMIESVILRAKKTNWSSNLVYMGGVALNCSANRLLGNYFEKIWIMPNPGDAGSSLGAAAFAFGKKLNWDNAFLGYQIKGNYPVNEIIKHLLNDRIVGVASGRAEFGPRALGNRSLLADPRGQDIKDKVNEIKRRQKFRPFAPVILEELVHEYFEMPKNWNESKYMQVIATCKMPELFPAITHVDGSSRVQTVAKDNSGIRKLLERWYQETGCPMLLNTSLNIRGEPMVNDRSDADRFEQMYNVKVLS